MKAAKAQKVNRIKTSLHLDTHVRKSDKKSHFLLRVYLGNKKYIYVRTGHFAWLLCQLKEAKTKPVAVFTLFCPKPQPVSSPTRKQ